MRDRSYDYLIQIYLGGGWITMCRRNPVHDGGWEMTHADATSLRTASLSPVRVVRCDGSIALELP